MSVSPRKRRVVDPRFAKGSRYRAVIHDIARAGVCPFCPEHFRWHTEPLLKRYGGWALTKNFNPYRNAALHLIIIATAHKERLEELTPADWRALSFLARWAIQKFKIRGGGIALRFGDTAYTGATVCHLHAHLIVPKLRGKKALPVLFPFG